MIRISKPKLNQKKAKQTISYILNKCGSMSEEKLQALLYFVSMDFYEIYEEHLTGLTFYKDKNRIKIK